jgi:hypothetical protein
VRRNRSIPHALGNHAENLYLAFRKILKMALLSTRGWLPRCAPQHLPGKQEMVSDQLLLGAKICRSKQIF